MNEPPDYSGPIAALRRADRVRSPEFVARMALIAVGTAAGTLLLGLQMLPLWLAVYCFSVALEKAVLSIWPSASSRRFFLLLVALSALISSTYAALPVYLWLQHDDTLKFGATVLLVGGVLNVLLVRGRIRQISAAYLAPLGVAFLAIAAASWQPPWGGPQFFTSIIIALAIIAYFIVAMLAANAAYRKLQETQQQFFQAQKMEAIGTLAGGIAHDFNNLLSVVQGNLEMMQTLEDEAARDACASAALTACWRGAALTRQLLALGRTSMLQPRRVDPAEVLFEVERLVRRVVPSNIGMSAEADSGLPPILADESTLQSALLNLAINARDAMPEGGTMQFEARRLPDTGDRPAFLPRGEHVALTVTDSGTGIPPAILDKIFDPFFSTKAKGRGTGLGLTMVDGFARQSGGQVRAESEPGKGTRITLYLPAHATDLSAPPEEEHAPRPAAADAAPGLGSRAAN